ncbi:hypothetical protein HRR90_000477 [Exophiala dermatitidis]|nr:hypothetical protein HRR75_001600 [Exophiala dermatitidis]KAJ4560169.1 hypothetical protein HRR78_000694 [Exophiala dermatitidis]KAJ4662166.1 hypothetical protein HRR90_000477 [Exophiala dermatitidis]
MAEEQQKKQGGPGGILTGLTDTVGNTVGGLTETVGNTVSGVGSGVGKTVGGATEGVSTLTHSYSHTTQPVLFCTWNSSKLIIDSEQQLGNTTKAVGDTAKSGTDSIGSIGGKKQDGDNPLGL